MAVITYLPTAAAQPVINPSRRGRYPRGITAIWRGRLIRARQIRLSNMATEAQQEIQGWDHVIAIAQQKRAMAQSTLINFSHQAERRE